MKLLAFEGGLGFTYQNKVEIVILICTTSQYIR